MKVKLSDELHGLFKRWCFDNRTSMQTEISGWIFRKVSPDLDQPVTQKFVETGERMEDMGPADRIRVREGMKREDK